MTIVVYWNKFVHRISDNRYITITHNTVQHTIQLRLRSFVEFKVIRHLAFVLVLFELSLARDLYSLHMEICFVLHMCSVDMDFVLILCKKKCFFFSGGGLSEVWYAIKIHSFMAGNGSNSSISQKHKSTDTEKRWIGVLPICRSFHTLYVWYNVQVKRT